MRRFAAIVLALYALILAGCGDTPTPTLIAQTPPAPTVALPTATQPQQTATLAPLPPAATSTIPASATPADTATASPAPTDTVQAGDIPVDTATPQAALPTLTVEEPDTGLPWKAYGNSNPSAPYGVIYPRFWQVVAENPANSTFTQLPQQVRFAAPGAAQWGGEIYSGPTPLHSTAQGLLRNFLDTIPDAENVRILPPLSDPMTAFAATGGFIRTTAQGVFTGTVDLYQKAAATYLIYSYYDSQVNPEIVSTVEGFYPLAPAAAVTPLAGGSTRSVSLPDIGTLPCPKGWPAGTTDAASHTLQCNNLVTGGMGNASIQVSLTTDTPTAAVAAQEASLKGLPYAQIRLAPDFFAYIVNSGLVGDRIEYLRVLPRSAATPGQIIILSDSGPTTDDLPAAILGFRPAK